MIDNINIKTYKNIYVLDNYIDNNRDVLYICALGSTSTAMNYKHGSQIQVPIIDIGSMIRNVVAEWESINVKIHQKLKIKEIIKNLIKENEGNIDYKKTLEYIQENLDDMASSIRLLCECGVYPDELIKHKIKLSKEEKIFIDIWNELELNDESINNFKCKLFRELDEKEIFKEKVIEGINYSITTQIKKMNSLLKNIKLQVEDIDKNIQEVDEDIEKYISEANNNPHKFKKYEKDIDDSKLIKKELDIKKEELEDKIVSLSEVIEKYNNIKINELPEKIVFQGFYFITPIQERFIQLFRKHLDINITFLNHYNKDYKSLFEIWEKTFSPGLETGYPRHSEWEEIDYSTNNIVTWAEKFAELYCEKDLLKDSIPNNTLKIVEYENIISFNSDLNTGLRYYSPEYKKLNEIFHNQNQAELESIKRLIKSPLGSFIKYVNKIWDNNADYKSLEEITYDIDLLKQCFGTGWLISTVNNETIYAVDYVYILQELKPYIGSSFNKKELETKLKERVDYRKKLKEWVSFNQISEDIIDGFNFYKLDIETDILLEFINGVNQIIEGLKSGSSNNKISINTFSNNIKQELIDRLNIFKEEFDEDEVKIIENLIALLNFENNIESNDESSFYIKDVIGTVEEFISVENDEDDIQMDRIIDLKDLSIESIVYNDEINICQITDKNTPGTKSRYTWPLSKVFIDKIGYEDRSINLLRRIVSIIENNELKNKYLFFNSLQSTNNINLSYIKNINNENIKLSPYVKLLLDSFGSIKTHNETYELGMHKYGIGYVSIENKDIEYKNMKYIEQIICEICPKRFMYFLADDKINTYELENHQGIYFSRFINVMAEKSIKERFKEKRDYLDFYNLIRTKIERTFLNWNTTEQQHFKIKAFNYRNNNRQDTNFLINYNSDYTTMIIPTVKEVYGYKNNKGNDKNDIGIIPKKTNNHKSIKMTRGIPNGETKRRDVCKNCNYLHYCRDSKYPVDLK